LHDTNLANHEPNITTPNTVDARKPPPANPNKAKNIGSPILVMVSQGSVFRINAKPFPPFMGAGKQIHILSKNVRVAFREKSGWVIKARHGW
jgi:hypothetical protein